MSLCICVYVYMCICVYVYMCICVYVSIYIYIYIYICICVYVCIHIYIYMFPWGLHYSPVLFPLFCLGRRRQTLNHSPCPELFFDYFPWGFPRCVWGGADPSPPPIPPPCMLPMLQRDHFFRGTSLKRNCFLLGPYSRPMPRVLWSSWWVGVLIGEVFL